MAASGGQRSLRSLRNATNSGGPPRRAISAPGFRRTLPPGLPPACGRRQRPPAGSMPPAGSPPPGAAGRRDPLGAFPRPSRGLPRPRSAAAAGRHRRGRAGPLRSPKRGRRTPRGRLPGHAAPAAHRDGPSRRATAPPPARNFALVQDRCPHGAARGEIFDGRQRGPELAGRESFISRRPARRSAASRNGPAPGAPAWRRRRRRPASPTIPRVAARPAPGAPPRAAGSASRPAIRAGARRGAGARAARPHPAGGPRAAPFPRPSRAPCAPSRAPRSRV